MLTAERHEYPDTDALVEDYIARGWTDGLPVIPPTPERVERFLAAAGIEGDEILGSVPTREVVCTAEATAINAVMAGCLPEYFPVVVAAVRAHLNERANCHSTTGTLTGAAHAVIVNGPIRREIELQCADACMGPGFRANATIGRALRLVIRNVCKAIPGGLDRATFSTPLRYSYCFGEDEEATTWTPLHVQRGFAPEDSAVTVQSVVRASGFWDTKSRTAEGVLETIIKSLRFFGVTGDAFVGDDVNVVLVFGVEHRRYLEDQGWSKERIQEYLLPRITAPAEHEQDWPVRVKKPEGILIVAAGGVGMAETWALFPHLASAVTERVVQP